MKLSIAHTTVYEYDRPVSDSFNDARLCPVSDHSQRCLSFALETDPPSPSLLRRLDFFTNQVHHFEVIEPHSRLCVTARSEVETFPGAAAPPGAGDPSPQDPRERFHDFLHASPLVDIGPAVEHESDAVGDVGASARQQAEGLMDHVYRCFTYRSGATAVDTSVREALRLRHGVCQDFAHVMLALCRFRGVPARYVSGYFHTARPAAGTADDNAQSHAWVECFLPETGWTGYDPTHNRPAGASYVKVAVGRDYSDARPLAGSFRGKATVQMSVSVTVERTG
jgi:transglutaminase-like putative cysteine protease